jgi:hypothetical protein
MTGGRGVTGKIQQSVIPFTEDICLPADCLFCWCLIPDFQPIDRFTKQEKFRLIYSAFPCPSGKLPVKPPTHFNQFRQAKKGGSGTKNF